MSAKKAIFITGGGSGIGRAIALRFAREGWFIGLGDIDSAGMAETTRLVGTGFTYSHKFDVRDRAAWDGALAAFAAEHAIPVVETQAGKSALAHDHAMNFGPVGVTGASSATAVRRSVARPLARPTVAVSSLLCHVAWLSQVKTRPEARPACTYSGAARRRRETKDKR